MFDTLQTGLKISDEQFSACKYTLRQRLLRAQFELEKSAKSVIVIIAGVDGAGKGTVVHRLNEWMNPAGIETHAFWDHSDEQSLRPFYWCFWQCMPSRGRIGIFFGSWYTQPIIDRAMGGSIPLDAL